MMRDRERKKREVNQLPCHLNNGVNQINTFDWIEVVLVGDWKDTQAPTQPRWMKKGFKLVFVPFAQ